MKPWAVWGVIVAKHILVVVMYVEIPFAPDSFTEMAQFGKCTRDDSKRLITVTIPMLSS